MVIKTVQHRIVTSLNTSTVTNLHCTFLITSTFLIYRCLIDGFTVVLIMFQCVFYSGINPGSVTIYCGLNPGTVTNLLCSQYIIFSVLIPGSVTHFQES